jgi:hypothetical protein
LVSLAASMYLFTFGKKAMAGRWLEVARKQIAVTRWQAVWVTLMVFAVGLFYDWLF